jgi:Uma2 family endonuclease
MVYPQKNKNITYAEYINLEEDTRFEVIENQVYYMTPSPKPKHQDVVTQLCVDFGSYLREKKCRVFVSPIDVCLSEEFKDLNKVKEWVSPDLIVVCDPNKIGDKRIIGSPDLVVEVLSPSTAKKDRLVKFNRYQKAGIKEYWIVDPVNEFIDVYLLKEGTYHQIGTFFNGDILPVSIFEDLKIDLTNIFRNEE